uniref:Uncharacterized protein n=1 Tax=Avena sativa TaxID=4498 RepID=A0ACD5X7H2_AVESA
MAAQRQQLADAIRDQAALSLRLLVHFNHGHTNKNLAFSPSSFHTILSLLASGATGPHRDQIATFLGPAGADAHAALASHIAATARTSSTTQAPPSCRDEDEDDDEPDLSAELLYATGIWVDSSLRLKPSFAAAAASTYDAAARSVSFCSSPDNARSEINAWLEAKTGGRWKALLNEGSIGVTTAIFLANALYFRAYWYDPFEKHLTEDGDFYVSPGQAVRAPFMAGSALHAHMCIGVHPGFKVLRMPYAGRYSMCIYLPDDRDGLPRLLRELADDPTPLLDVPERRVPVGDLRIPKFEASLSVEASGILQDLGLDLPFIPSTAGESFSEMLELDDVSSSMMQLAVSSVIHQCSVHVNEKGTVAAAATVLEMLGFGMPSDPEMVVDLVADHTFLFIIRQEKDNSGVVLFAGQVVNPLLD